MPESLEALDLLLVMVATPRTVHRDGIRFQGIRYIDPTLAAFVGERVTIRYDPRDLGEVRVFHRDRCRAISPTHASEQISQGHRGCPPGAPARAPRPDHRTGGLRGGPQAGLVESRGGDWR